MTNLKILRRNFSFQWIIVGFLFFGFNLIHAQDLSKSESDRLLKLSYKLEGTYQIQVIDSRELPAIHLSLMDTIAEKRKLSEIAYYYVKPNTRIKILPLAEIQKAGFLPVAKIEHIASKDAKIN